MRRLFLCVALAACGDDGAMSVDGGPGGDGVGSDGTSTCNRMPAAEDRTRYVVIARPYAAGGGNANMYEVLSLSASGTLAQMTPPALFSLGGRASTGTIAFTEDGKVGFVAFNEGGRIGVFSLADDGTPTVIDQGFQGTGYPAAVRVVGDTLYIVDRNTRNNGGGIYAATINCDGTLTDRGIIVAARSPVGIAFRGDTAVIGARDLLDHEVLGDEVHLATFGATPSRVAGGDAFGDDDQVMTQFALSSDGNTVFIGDGNFGGVNRVGIASITSTSVTFEGTVVDISDPGGLAVSPFGNVALVSAAQGNRLFHLDKNGAGNTWRKVEVTTTGGNPQIPADMVGLDRGMLRGHVWVSENTSIRHVRFTQAGAVEDLGSLAFGSGLQNIPGAIGITP